MMKVVFLVLAVAAFVECKPPGNHARHHKTVALHPAKHADQALASDIFTNAQQPSKHVEAQALRSDVFTTASQPAKLSEGYALRSDIFTTAPQPAKHAEKHGSEIYTNAPQVASHSKASQTQEQSDEIENMKVIQEQAKSARYHFSTNITDKINDGSFEREETRDGLNVDGFYSYSDGNVKRTVYYKADDKGFRITKTLQESLDGPHINPEGVASVHTDYNGNQLTYSIKGVKPSDESDDDDSDNEDRH